MNTPSNIDDGRLPEGAVSYVVGGAVRDQLLGLPVHDRDHVVVGTTPSAMIAAGFIPVGRDFPVFLHPRTHEQYALARTERKVAKGYKGFTFYAAADVTLVQDLARRDLTINAIAQDQQGQLIDPYGGQIDLRARRLRHVSAAFVEDPLRLLRVARFAARFSDFTIAPETQRLMATMAQQGEVAALVAERVWQELARGLMEQHPARMVQVLVACGAWQRMTPDSMFINAPTDLVTNPALAALERAAHAKLNLAERFAVLMASLGADDVFLTELSQYWRIPNDCRDLAQMLVRYGELLEQHDQAENVLQVLECCDALRRPQRFAQMLAAYQAKNDAEPDFLLTWSKRLDVVRTLDSAAIAQAYQHTPELIAEQIRAARLQKMRDYLATESSAA